MNTTQVFTIKLHVWRVLLNVCSATGWFNGWSFLAEREQAGASFAAVIYENTGDPVHTRSLRTGRFRHVTS